ncbi:MAG: SH3 domain-containing protein [Bacteroidetes bacterium]|nr:SH3 domain-containing protein [Bacteroidota bacterium]
MPVQDKYQELLTAATQAGVTDLKVNEENGVLHIEGVAPSGTVKDMLWATYDKIDPNYLSGDLVMNIYVDAAVPVTSALVTTETSNLNIRKGPGTDQAIVGKAAHHEIVTVISQTNELWWLIKTKDGEEGYAYAQYLTPQTEVN